MANNDEALLNSISNVICMRVISWEVECARLGCEKLAYIAGFLDGDGCIASNFEKCNPRKDSSYRVRIRISFTQIVSRREVLDALLSWIQSGHIAEYEHNNMAEYVIHDQKVIQPLLIALLPYLIVKKRHAEVALLILELKKSGYTPESLEQMRQYTISIRSFNHYPKRTVLTP